MAKNNNTTANIVLGTAAVVTAGAALMAGQMLNDAAERAARGEAPPEPYAVTTILAQIGGPDAVRMMNCANRVVDPSAPLIPADLQLAGPYEIAANGEVVYDGRDSVNPAAEARDLEWYRLVGEAQGIMETYSAEDRYNAESRSAADNARIDALYAQAAALYDGHHAEGLVVQVIRNQRFGGDGTPREDQISLSASTSEGAQAPRTYGDSQFWIAHGITLGPAGAIVDVRQLDQSIGFSGGYSREVRQADVTPEQRDRIAGCYAPAINAAKATLGS